MTIERPIIVTIDADEVDACRRLFQRIYDRATQCGFGRDRYAEDEEEIIVKFINALAIVTDDTDDE
jgi:hypothetical protein